MSVQSYGEPNVLVSEIGVNVKRWTQLLESIDESVLQSICVLCKQYLTEKRISKKRYLSTKQTVLSSHRLDSNSFDLLLNGALQLAISCLPIGHSLDGQCIENELIKRMKIPEKSTKIFLNQLFAYNSVDSKQHKHSLLSIRRQSYSLRSIRWRIDVSISDAMLSRIMEPLIVLELVVVTNNSIDCNHYSQQLLVFECTTSEFHRLRFTVAHLLKQLNQIQQKSIK